jgi:Protein of unknown function (DUF3501)
VDRRLNLADIEDLRAYERTRQGFRAKIIELKRKRRVAVGPLLTLVFENRETIRFQVQEMARVEKMISDDQIQEELDVYNPLIPTPGELSATLFIELTSEGALREWLAKLVGIERAIELWVGAGPGVDVVRCVPEASHERALTRDAVTSSVHYIRFVIEQRVVDRFAEGPVTLAATHPEYREETLLTDPTRLELMTDLRP